MKTLVGLLILLTTLASIFLIFHGFYIIVKEVFRDGRNKLILSPVKHNKANADLRYYYVDTQNNLYSMNPLTWEISPRKGQDILRCSDNSKTKSGKIVNSLRTTSGEKVTLTRDKLQFDPDKSFVIKVNKITDRHFKIV